MAADLTITPEPALVAPVTDAEYEAAGWRFFDPGFLADHLPFKLTIGQTISYSDNVDNLPNGSNLIGLNGIQRLPSRGDFYSDTTISIASRFPQGAQTFFFNGTYAPRRYFTDTALNANNFSINGGVDFNLANRCSGRVIAGIDQSQQSLFETAGGGVNTVTLTSVNETARCTISGHLTGLINTGASMSENTGGTEAGGLGTSFALNDYNQQYIGFGLEYALSSLDTLRGQVTLTNRDFTNRPVGSGLLQQTEQDDFQVYYSRVFSAKLDANASGGFSLFSFPNSNAASLVEPAYSFGINYHPTPKITAAFVEARSSGAPQSAVSNIETNDTQSVSLSYRYSPKTSVSAVLSHSESRNPQGVSNNLIASNLVFTNSNSDAASLILSYQATPLLTATAAYTYQDRTNAGGTNIAGGANLDAVSNVFRVGLFYTR